MVLDSSSMEKKKNTVPQVIYESQVDGRVQAYRRM